ncbi:MAG: hypothetical protein ACTS4X_00295 [Candidatus Hodgkinia cicadicola]
MKLEWKVMLRYDFNSIVMGSLKVKWERLLERFYLKHGDHTK